MRQSAPADPTTAPPPCLTCGGVVHWRGAGTSDLRCGLCMPPTDPVGALWYTAADPLADLADGDTRAALDHLHRTAPDGAAEVRAVLRQLEAVIAAGRDTTAALAQLRALLDDARAAWWAARTAARGGAA